MNDSKHPQGICEFMDEDALITGGKSVSEIIQMLRTNEKVKKIVKGCDDNEDREEQSRKVSFPWMLQFGASCKDVISNPSIGKLDKLMSIFLKNIEKDVKQCSKKPKRAYRLRLRMNPFIILFHMIYWEIKKPLEHTSYLEKMSDIMALFIDVELKSSRIARENPKKISQRICSSLYVLLDKSTDHILDSVLKSTFFNKNYHEICVPIIERLLKDHPGKLDEATYVRYLLSFKLWKKLAGRDQYVNINKEASVKLKPPPNLAESLKSSRLSNVLPFPYLSKKESLTNFFMRSPFDVKEKAKLFLKDGRKFQPSSDFEKAFLFDEVNCFDKDLEMDQSNTMDDIFNSLVDKEIDPLHELLDSESLDEEDDILINLKTSKSKNKLKRTVTDKVSSSLGKMALKKRKLSKPNVCVPIKNVSTKEPYGIVTPEMKHLIIPVTAKEENAIVFSVDESLKKEEKTNLSLTNSPEVLQKKPCATVEPEQCKEVEADSQSKSEGILSKHNMKSPVNSFETSKERAAVHDKPIKEISDSSKSLQSYEIIDITSPINETDIEETLSDLVDSTESCEEVKIETEPNTQGIFVVHQIYKDSKEYEEPLLEVAEEVIIDTEVSQDDGLLIMEGEHQVKLNPNEIMNVIGVPKDSRPFCPDSEDISSETWKKCQEQKEISLLRNELNSLCNESKFNFAKDQSSGLTNSQQLLSPYNNNGECLLDLIQDSYAYNEIKMTSLLSVEINGDDESDDDHRHPNKQFAKGGKFPAFRAQTDESKSDGGEESEAPSPASQTDSNTVEVSPQSTNSQVANSSPAHVNLQDSTQEKKYELKGDILPLPTPTKQTKPSLVSPLQLPEVSVSLSYMTDLGNLNDYHLNTDKNNTKGKRGSSRKSSSHQSNKKQVQMACEESAESDDALPLSSLGEKSSSENKTSKSSSQKKSSRTKAASSSRVKSKTNHSPPTLVKPPPQPAAKKKRSKRKQ